MQQTGSVQQQAAIPAFHDGRIAWPIQAFCKAFGVSRAAWRELERAGDAPATNLIGSKPMVTAQAALEWMRRRPPAEPQTAEESQHSEKLRAYLRGKRSATMQEILEHCLQLPREQWTRAVQSRVGIAMHAIGWRKKDRGGGTNPRKVYLPA